MRSRLIILGAGGHGRVVASTARAAGFEIDAFYDDDSALWGRTVDGIRVAGPIDDLLTPSPIPAVIAIGDNRTRSRIAERLDLAWAIVRHPASYVAPEAALGVGTVLSPGAVVQPGANVGAHVILNVHAVVDHDAHVADHAHLSGAHLGAGARIGVGAFMGLGSIVLPGIHLGDWAILGAGSVAIADVEAGTTAVGVPARTLAVTARRALKVGGGDGDAVKSLTMSRFQGRA
jgi:sugar O-acyltransferase (sialic acid O-acetyltransferase NeuD family)